MQEEFKPTGTGNYSTTAKDRFQTGTIPAWVVECPYSSQFTGEHHSPITYLLQNVQIHAERRELFVQHVIRLETMEAVQHFSQWRLQFEPKTQLITLHTLKVRRGEVETDHMNPEKAHILQREEGLEKFVILGWFTFLMILEDVRPGDVLEFAYTIQTQPRLLPNNSSFFFTLPQGVSVGKYHFAAQFDPARGMKWKSSAAKFIPMESQADGMVLWKWEGENFSSPKPENHTPSWYIASSWIQISDFPDWKTIATAISGTWTADGNDQAITAIAQGIESKETDITSRIESAIRLVQDEYRYFSVNLEFGGQIPSNPEAVIQRRFGDCKDLSWLLVILLKKLGVPARPILVNTFRRKTVGELLPTPSLFNHVIVEFESDGKRRWVDTTLKQQGGGPFNRFIANFDLGLPIDAHAVGLASAPQIPDSSNLFELNENLLLATSGEPSQVAVVQKNEGLQADLIRQQLATVGLEEMAQKRLQAAAGRFRNANRVGPLKYRDDRTANRFVLAEIFEFHPFLADHANNKLCRIHLPTNWITGALTMPEKPARNTPFALPYPCRVLHVVDVESPAIQEMKIRDPRSELSSPFVEFSRTDKTGRGYLLIRLELETKLDALPADQVVQHSKVVEQVYRAANRELSILRGYSGPRKKSSFGELPPIPSNTSPPPLPARLPAGIVPSPKRNPSAPAQHRHKKKEYRHQNFPTWLKVVLAVFVALGLSFMILLKLIHHP